jgi:hypothetical protein
MRERLVDEMFVGGTSIVWARACEIARAGAHHCGPVLVCGSAEAEFVLTARVILKHWYPPGDRH